MIYISIAHWNTMLEHVRRCAPEEACGLLGGKGDKVIWVYPISNIARSPERFRMDPLQQVEALMQIDEGGELVGIYHSHPSGPTTPSELDIKEAAYPEAAYLVWAKQDEEWQCRAFFMLPEGPREIQIHLEE